MSDSVSNSVIPRPRVSVCVVTCNHERYIGDCLTSVLGQAHDVSLEILVGDDASEDGTTELVASLARQYPETIRHFRHSQRKGASANFQFLIGSARGEYIAHLDGDDYWLPGKLREQIRYLDQRPDCPAVYSNALVVSDGGEFLGLFNNPLGERFDLNALLRRGNFLNHSSLCYRASHRDELLAWKEAFLDYRIHLQLCQYGPIGYQNRLFVGYRRNSSTSMVVNSNDWVRELYWDAIQRVPKDQVVAGDLGRCRAEFIRSVLLWSLRIRSWKLFRKWWPRMVAAPPAGPIHLAWWTSVAVIRECLLELINLVSVKFSAGGARVFYWR